MNDGSRPDSRIEKRLGRLEEMLSEAMKPSDRERPFVAEYRHRLDEARLEIYRLRCELSGYDGARLDVVPLSLTDQLIAALAEFQENLSACMRIEFIEFIPVARPTTSLRITHTFIEPRGHVVYVEKEAKGAGERVERSKSAIFKAGPGKVIAKPCGTCGGIGVVWEPYIQENRNVDQERCDVEGGGAEMHGRGS